MRRVGVPMPTTDNYPLPRVDHPLAGHIGERVCFSDGSSSTDYLLRGMKWVVNALVPDGVWLAQVTRVGTPASGGANDVMGFYADAMTISPNSARHPAWVAYREQEARS